MASYISLNDAKAWLSITDNSEDETLPALIEMASGAIADLCNREFAVTQVTEWYTGLGTGTLFLRNTPIQSVDQVLDAGTPVTCSWDSLSLTANGVTFDAGDSIQVTYTAGFPTIPGPVAMATRLTVAAMRNAAAFDPNLAGDSMGGVVSASFDPSAGLGSVPRGAQRLLTNYVKRYYSS